MTISYIRLSPRSERILNALLIAAGAAAPFLVHAAGGNGKEILPIFFALSIGASILSVPHLLLLAFSVPLINHLMFGMPAAPMLAVLLAESFVFCMVIFAGRKYSLPFFLLLVLGFLSARLSGGIVYSLLFSASDWLAYVLGGSVGLGLNTALGWGFYWAVKKQRGF